MAIVNLSKCEKQEHPLADGGSMVVYRDGRHRYYDEEAHVACPSVTTTLVHLDPPFGAGKGWAVKLIKDDYTQQGKDGVPHFDIPDIQSSEARKLGNELHNAIDEYIKDGTVDESNLAFSAWFKEFSRTEWVASEQFVLSSGEHGLFGGTLDAISMDKDGELVLHDWKSKSSFREVGRKDMAQIGGYYLGLKSMGSAYLPQKAVISYVLRDGSGLHNIPVNLEYCVELFKSARHLWTLTVADHYYGKPIAGGM